MESLPRSADSPPKQVHSKDGLYQTLYPVDVGYAYVMPRPPKLGGAVFEPRSLSGSRKKFGRSRDRLTAGDVESPQQAAAELQHAIANTIREYMLDQNMDLKTYCDTVDLPRGLTYERFQRINRGETMITLTDIMFWAGKIPGLAAFIGHTIASITTPPDRAGSPGPTPDPAA